jgi:hypothetical protein
VRVGRHAGAHEALQFLLTASEASDLRFAPKVVYDS